MDKLGKLSETEQEVIDTIWDLATPVTVSKLLGIFIEDKAWKTSTISTILARLIEKGFLKKSMEGKVNVYTPIISSEEYKQYETKSFIKTVHKGSVKSFMAALVQDSDMSDIELLELKEWFKEKTSE